jgi:hypothetical protein
MSVHKKQSNNNNNKINEEEKENSNLLDVNDLFNLSEIAFQVELAFATAYSMSKSNETMDEYNALTDNESLNKVLEQGLDNEEYQGHRAEIVNLFMGIKDRIKIEDLTLYEPIFTSNMQKSKCSVCNVFANIYCSSCKEVWLCVDHWKQHRTSIH